MIKKFVLVGFVASSIAMLTACSGTIPSESVALNQALVKSMVKQKTAYIELVNHYFDVQSYLIRRLSSQAISDKRKSINTGVGKKNYTLNKSQFNDVMQYIQKVNEIQNDALTTIESNRKKIIAEISSVYDGNLTAARSITDLLKSAVKKQQAIGALPSGDTIGSLSDIASKITTISDIKQAINDIVDAINTDQNSDNSSSDDNSGDDDGGGSITPASNTTQ